MLFPRHTQYKCPVGFFVIPLFCPRSEESFDSEGCCAVTKVKVTWKTLEAAGWGAKWLLINLSGSLNGDRLISFYWERLPQTKLRCVHWRGFGRCRTANAGNLKWGPGAAARRALTTLFGVDLLQTERVWAVHVSGIVPMGCLVAEDYSCAKPRLWVRLSPDLFSYKESSVSFRSQNFSN